MPIYRYRIEAHDVEFEIFHSIAKATMKNMDQVLAEIEEKGPECMAGLKNDEATELAEWLKQFAGEEIHTVIDSAPAVQFKGGGWPGESIRKSNINNFVGAKDKGKIQDSVEGRRKRMSNGHSVVDVRSELGVSPGGGSVINNKEWDKLTAGQKNIAKENGLKPSKAFEK